MGEPTALRDQLLASVALLLTHEFDDLHRADLDGDPEAKHRAKTSFRQTLRLLADFHEEPTNETPSGDERIAKLPERAQDMLTDVAEAEVEEILSVE